LSLSLPRAASSSWATLTCLAPLAICLAVVAALVVAACGDGAAPGADGGPDSGFDTNDTAPDGSNDAADTDGAGPGAVDARPDDGLLEICWNGHDDDGDGLLDCASPACAGDESCGALGVAAIDRQWRDLGVDGVIEEETTNTYRDEGTLASITIRYDDDSDGAADYVQFIRYTEDGHIELEEVDTNGDGTWDWRRTATYVGGELDTLDIDEDADGVPDARYEMRYDERGRPVHLVGVDENGDDAIVWDYHYDEDGRLSRVDYRASGNGPVASSLEYFYRDDGTVESTRSSRDGRWRFFDRFGRNTESEWDDDRDGYYDRRIIYQQLYSGGV
jgi:hypothetical protein